jgi:hypothetical protein
VRPSFPPRSPLPLRRLIPSPARRRVGLRVLAAGASLLLAQGAAAPAAAAPVNTADEVIDFDPGANAEADTSFEHPEAALGELNGDTGFGGLTPFNPAFSPDDIVAIGAGGSLTLKTALPFATGGVKLGVFVNNGLVDVSDDGSGLAGHPPGYFSATPRARVAVSADNLVWEYLNGGGVIDFDKPTNVYLDEPIVNYFQEVGDVRADMSKAWDGELDDLAGLDYGGILAEFDGSAGGTWLSLDGLTLPAARYVRFEATDSRMVVDAIATTESLPEPSAGVALLGGLFLMLRRGRRG